MRRRSFLAAATGATLGTAGVWAGSGRAAAHTPPAGTPPDGTAVAPDAAPHSRLELPDAAEAVVGADGTTVYVASQDGFAVVDASDAHDLTPLASVDGILESREAGPMENIQDVKVDGDRLLVVGPANPRPVVAAAVVYDVSDPAAPERVGVHETDYPIHNAFLLEGRAYLTGNDGEDNPLVIVDVDGDPAERSRWSLVDENPAWEDVAPTLRVVHDVWVQDGQAYLAHWDAGTWIVDVSDPEAPATVSRVRGRDPETLAAIEDQEAIVRESTERPGNDHFVTVNEDATLLGIGVEAWDDGGDGAGGPGGIEFYDVADPTDPTHVGSIDPPSTRDPARDGVWTTAHNFELSAGHCYSSWYQGGVRVHDVSDPSTPRERYAWRDARVASFWTARRALPGETFVASSVGVGGDIGPDVPDADDDTGTATAGDSVGDGDPALYVFPDPVGGPTATTTTSPSGGADSAVGPGFGPLAALAGVGALALGLRRHVRDD